MHVTIATPYWRDDRRPESINTSEDEDAEFECNVNGFPKPTITWTVNGKSLDGTLRFGRLLNNTVPDSIDSKRFYSFLSKQVLSTPAVIRFVAHTLSHHTPHNTSLSIGIVKFNQYNT